MRDIEAFATECPYFPDRRSTGVIGWLEPGKDDYESLIRLGWRRTGGAVYKYGCKNCARCIPLRIRWDEVRESRKARQAARRNEDLSVGLVTLRTPVEEHFALYDAFVRQRFGQLSSADNLESYLLLVGYPGTLACEYRDADGKLLGLGILDRLPGGLSSVYFAYLPEQRARGLGFFSMVEESRLSAEACDGYYYLGYWVPDARSMDYKADLGAFEIAVPDLDRPDVGGDPEWRHFKDKAHAKARIGRWLSDLERR